SIVAGSIAVSSTDNGCGGPPPRPPGPPGPPRPPALPPPLPPGPAPAAPPHADATATDIIRPIMRRRVQALAPREPTQLERAIRDVGRREDEFGGPVGTAAASSVVGHGDGRVNEGPGTRAAGGCAPVPL